MQFTPVLAATKSPAGQICKKKSATTTFASEKYICKLVGKKLLWTLQIKKVVQPTQPVLSWAEIEAKAAADKAIAGAKAAADKAIADAKVAAEKEASDKAAAEAKSAAEAKVAADKAAMLAAQKPLIIGLQIGNLLWSEDFLGTSSESLNSKNWSARNCHRTPSSYGGGACFGTESVYYAPSAVKLDGSIDGAAIISTVRINGALPPDAGDCLSDSCSFVSARFDTHGKVAFKYGYIEARIKMPAGSGNHPAFWMLGDNINSVGWPLSGEMDITEIQGDNPYGTTSATHYSIINSPNICCSNHFYSVGALNINADVSAGYHLYSLAWLPDSISYYADGRLVYSTSPAKMSPSGIWSFNQEFFLIFNNAVNARFSGSWAGLQSSTMSIDWVRSYQVNGFGEVTTK